MAIITDPAEIVIVKSLQQNVAEGEVPRYTNRHILGYNATVGASLLTDITESGETIIPLPTSASAMEVLSTSASDMGSRISAGARTVRICGLDNDYLEIKETVILNGINTVVTENSYRRVNDFHVITAGSGNVAAGDISLRDVGGRGNIYSKIMAGGNMNLQCHYTIPDEKTGFVDSWSGGSSGIQSMRLILRITASRIDGDVAHNPNIFHFQDIGIADSGTFQIRFSHPLKVPAKADIKVSGQVIGENETGQGCAQFELMIRNEVY